MISASNILLNSKKFSDPVTENQNSSLDSNHEHEQQAGDEQQQQQEQKKKKRACRYPRMSETLGLPWLAWSPYL